MRISTFFYTLKQGIVNIFRNKWFSLASIATISACLFLFGLFYAMLINFQHIVKTAEEGVSVTILFDEGVTLEQMQQIGAMVEARDEVASVHFISADEAWEEFSVDYFGDNVELYKEGFPDNPLEGADSYEIYLKDVESQAGLVEWLEGLDGIREVNRSELAAMTLSGVNALIAYVSVGIIVILFAVSIFLINNTVMIGISVRKEEINIMKYIGATDFFVRSPFVIEGMLIGAVGSLIPLGIIYGLYHRLIAYVTEKFSSLADLLQFLPAEEVFRTLIPISIGIGVGIGFLGSVTTVRKHLRV